MSSKVGTKSGTVAFYINGFLLAASADLNQISRYADASGLPMAVKDIAIGGTELNTFSVLSSDKNLKVGDNFILGNDKKFKCCILYSVTQKCVFLGFGRKSMKIW